MFTPAPAAESYPARGMVRDGLERLAPTDFLRKFLIEDVDRLSPTVNPCAVVAGGGGGGGGGAGGSFASGILGAAKHMGCGSPKLGFEILELVFVFEPEVTHHFSLRSPLA